VDNHTHQLQRLAELASHPGALDAVFEGTLHSLCSHIPFELAALYELNGDTLRVRAASGSLASQSLKKHEVSLSRLPAVGAALKEHRVVAVNDPSSAGLYDGVLALPAGHPCIIVPLFVGDRPLGILALDRSADNYDEAATALAGLYGQVVSIALAYAQQAELLSTAHGQLQQHNALLSQELSGGVPAIDQLTVGTSTAMIEAIRLAQQVAPSDAPVLVRGETGTGKELFAQAIHELSPRSNKPFLKLNCAATPEARQHSELFSRFIAADGGTLLLEDIADLSLATQAELVAILEQGQLSPIGSDSPLRVNVRVIASTHSNLQEAVQSGRFREDLYLRIAVFPIPVPALTERTNDIGLLAEAILAGFRLRTGRGPWSLAANAVTAMQACAWPGNVRQLVNVLERATIVVSTGLIGPEDLGLPQTSDPAAAVRAMSSRIQQSANGTDILPWRDAERRHLMAALHATGGKIYGNDGAAQLLDLKPTTLQSKLKKHGIDRSMV